MQPSEAERAGGEMAGENQHRESIVTSQTRAMMHFGLIVTL